MRLGETTLLWEDPPEDSEPSRTIPWWKEILPKVMERPGYWACIRIYEGNPLSARAAMHGMRKLLKEGKIPGEGRWEFRFAAEGDIGKVYCRYTENGTIKREVSDE